MNHRFTQRGFGICEFTDAYGAYCSLQESSAGRFEGEDGAVSDGFVWLGMDKNYEGHEAHTHVDTLGDKISSRMHLSQSAVKELLPLLQYFAEHGELPQNNQSDERDENSG